MKRRYLFLSLASCLPFLSTSCQEHKTEANQESNPGYDLVQESIKAHGGKETWYSSGDFQFRWTYYRTDVGPDAIVNSKQTINPKSLAVVHTVPGSTTTFGWADGKNWVKNADGKFKIPTQFWSLLPVYFIGIPFVFDDDTANFEMLPDKIAFEGKDYDQVKITYPEGAGESPDDYYVLLIDPETKVTRGTYYTVTHPAVVGPDGPGPAKFLALDELKDINGVLLSTSQRTFKMADGKIMSQMRNSTATEMAFIPSGVVDLSIPSDAKMVE